MLLEGSCACGEVIFSVQSAHPYPYNLCYCSVCRKTAGAGGYAINLEAENSTLKVEGGNNVRIYQAKIRNEQSGELEKSKAERHFCGLCSSNLWVWDPRWPELLHPFASAIDSELPAPPQRTHLMLDFKAEWVPLHCDGEDKQFARYPDESIAEWHKRHNL